MERRLAAILAADVVGYSKQMESAEERTAEGLAQCQSTIAEAAGYDRDAVLLAVERWYDFLEFGCYPGNVGLSDS